MTVFRINALITTLATLAIFRGLTKVLGDGQSAMSDASFHRLLGGGPAYHRLQPRLPTGLGRLDDTSRANIEGLQRSTREFCTEKASELDQIAAQLAG